MDNPLKIKITEFPNGAHERASHTTIETIYKGLMNKIGAGQVTIDLFSLYILFSHFRPRDALMGICLLFFH